MKQTKEKKEKCEERLSVRVSSSLKNILTKQAAAEDRSVADYVKYLLHKCCELNELTHIDLAISSYQKFKLEDEAKEKNMTLNDYIIYLINKNNIS